jgi:hypothetical protein
MNIIIYYKFFGITISPVFLLFTPLIEQKQKQKSEV